MNDLINNDDSSESDNSAVTVNSNKANKTKGLLKKSTTFNHTLPYYSVLLTKNGQEKIKNGKEIFELPLRDLVDPPHISAIYTIGDLLRFLEQYQYIKKAVCALD